MNKNKGLTLVALVITVIILLILAGISIASLTGSGLFENAKLAEALKEFTNDFVKIEKGTFADTNRIYSDWEKYTEFKRDVILSSFFISKNPISKEVYESINNS